MDNTIMTCQETVNINIHNAVLQGDWLLKIIKTSFKQSCQPEHGLSSNKYFQIYIIFYLCQSSSHWSSLWFTVDGAEL